MSTLPENSDFEVSRGEWENLQKQNKELLEAKHDADTRYKHIFQVLRRVKDVLEHMENSDYVDRVNWAIEKRKERDESIRSDDFYVEKLQDALKICSGIPEL